MAKKKVANGGIANASGSSTSTSPIPPKATATPEPSAYSRVDIMSASASLTAAGRDPIKVNNVNAADLKNACDDAVKKLLSQPGLFQEKHTHTDVKLLLGWASVFVAAGTALYGWKVDFEQSKALVWAGVILYVLLTTTSTLYAFFVEKDTVFVGRRKTLAKRIETEHVDISSRTLPHLIPGASPRYRVSVSYVRSSNGGKSLLGRGQASEERPYSDFFDEEGTMDQERFERWVGVMVERVMES